MLEVAGAVARAKGRALEEQGRLRHLAVRDGGVALVAELDLQARQGRDLPAHLREALFHVLSQVVRDCKVATLDLDLHGDPLVVDVGFTRG